MRLAGKLAVRAVGAWLLLVAPGMAFAQQPQASAGPEGQPTSEAPLRDAEFGVVTRQFGLQRKVEMYQWRRYGPGYRKVWEAQPIDSSAHAEAYRNPGAFPIQTRYWIATRVVLDGKPVDQDVLKVLGQWRGFRPGFSALPGNLAATFQPEGDGLGSAENPLEPQVGDLRVTWRELTLPPLAGKVAMENGSWVPVVAPGAADPAVAGTQTDAIATDANRPSHRAWLLAGAGLLAVVALGLVLRRRWRRRGS